jgi:hypothetical protein
MLNKLWTILHHTFHTTVSLHSCEDIYYNVNCWTFRSYPVCNTANGYVAGWPRPGLSRKIAILDHQTGLYKIWLFFYLFFAVNFCGQIMSDNTAPSLYAVVTFHHLCAVLYPPCLSRCWRQPTMVWDISNITLHANDRCAVLLCAGMMMSL